MGRRAIRHQVDCIQREIAEGLLEGESGHGDSLRAKLLDVLPGLRLIPLAGLDHRLLPGIDIARIGDEIKPDVAGQRLDDTNELLLGPGDTPTLLGGLRRPLLGAIPNDSAPAIGLSRTTGSGVRRQHAAGHIENKADVLAGDRGAKRVRAVLAEAFLWGSKKSGRPFLAAT